VSSEINGKLAILDGPDFICIGMPKAGTGWLYDQLQSHPDFWMPPVKEVLYLYRKQPKIPLEGTRGGFGLKHLQEGDERRRKRPHELPRDRSLDLGFIEAATLCNNSPRDLNLYAALFRFKGERLSGDISPVYADLDGEMIAQVAERFPFTKLVMMVREPISRVWSRLNMLPAEKFDETLLEDSTRFRNFLQTSPIIRDLSYPTQVVQRWRSKAPKLPQHHFLLDDVAGEPEKTRADIWSYLGADANKSTPLPADYNRKRKGAKPARLEMNETARSALIEVFRDELIACAAMFGSRAQQWPAKYGL